MVVGRFAPSPTGPLHFGSLVAAVASYCDVKSRNGQWLLRIEDVDQTRCLPNVSVDIISTLQRFGFEWDAEIIYQSQRTDLYAQALSQLHKQGLAYACTCSRKEIADSSTLQGIEGILYPGTCLVQPIKPGMATAWRIKTDSRTIQFHDRIQGAQQHQMRRDIGDFVIQRADGLFSYQLAVVVDDAMQGITHVVRGADLLHSTTRQIYLQQHLGHPTPVYAHIGLVRNAQGQKLSKQTLAAALPSDNLASTLRSAFDFLPQLPNPAPALQSIPALWQWAMESWQLR